MRRQSRMAWVLAGLGAFVAVPTLITLMGAAEPESLEPIRPKVVVSKVPKALHPSLKADSHMARMFDQATRDPDQVSESRGRLLSKLRRLAARWRAEEQEILASAGRHLEENTPGEG